VINNDDFNDYEYEYKPDTTNIDDFNVDASDEEEEDFESESDFDMYSDETDAEDTEYVSESSEEDIDEETDEDIGDLDAVQERDKKPVFKWTDDCNIDDFIKAFEEIKDVDGKDILEAAREFFDENKDEQVAETTFASQLLNDKEMNQDLLSLYAFLYMTVGSNEQGSKRYVRRFEDLTDSYKESTSITGISIAKTDSVVVACVLNAFNHKGKSLTVRCPNCKSPLSIREALGAPFVVCRCGTKVDFQGKNKGTADPNCPVCNGIHVNKHNISKLCSIHKKGYETEYSYNNSGLSLDVWWSRHIAANSISDYYGLNSAMAGISSIMLQDIEKLTPCDENESDLVHSVVDDLMSVYELYSHKLLTKPTGVLGFGLVQNKGKVKGSAVCANFTENKDKKLFADTVFNEIDGSGTRKNFNAHIQTILKGVIDYEKLMGRSVLEQNQELIKLFGAYQDTTLNLSGRVKFTVKNGVLKPSAKSSLSFSGFHIPHLYGYYKDPEQGYIKIDWNSEEARTKFRNYLIDIVDIAVKKLFYDNLENLVIPEFKIKIEGKGIKTFTNLKEVDAVMVAAELPHAGLASDDEIVQYFNNQDFITGVMNVVAAFSTLVREALTTIFIFKEFTDAIYSLDILSYLSMKNKDDVNTTISCGSCVANLYSKMLQTNEGSMAGLSNQLFGDNIKARTQAIVANGVSELVSLTANSLYSLSIVMDKDRHFAYPQFAYKPMKVLRDRNLLDSNAVLLGKTLKGEDVKLYDITSKRSMTIFATSRAGKGVMTLAILGLLLTTGKPMAYIDFKPDMAGLMIDVQNRMNKLMKIYNLQEAVKGKWQAMGIPFEVKQDGSIEVKFLACEMSVAPDSIDSNPNWKKLNPIAAKDLKALQAVNESNVNSQWKKYFNIEAPDSDESASVIQFLRYAKVAQLAIVLNNLNTVKDDRVIFVMDEINSVLRDSMPGSGVSMYIAETKAKYLEKMSEMKSKKDVDGFNKVQSYKVNFDKFAFQFLGTLDGNKKVPSSVDLSNNAFYKFLLDYAAKKGAFPLYIFIGQRYNDIIALMSNKGNNSENRKIWVSELFEIIGNEAIQIQGNWESCDGPSTSNKSNYVQAIRDLVDANAPEYTGEFIHEGTGGVSGFFAVREAGKTQVVQTYLVLNDNHKNYIEGAHNVRERSHSALKKAVAKKQIRKVDIDDDVNSLIYRDYEVTKLKFEHKEKSEGGKDAYVSHLETPEWESMREPAVGFLGYMLLLQNIDLPYEATSGDAFDASRVGDIIAQTQKLCVRYSYDEMLDNLATLIANFGASYLKLESIFKRLGITKAKGYKSISEYIYDLSPDSFVSYKVLCSENPEVYKAFIKKQFTVVDSVSEDDDSNEEEYEYNGYSSMYTEEQATQDNSNTSEQTSDEQDRLLDINELFDADERKKLYLKIKRKLNTTIAWLEDEDNQDMYINTRDKQDIEGIRKVVIKPTQVIKTQIDNLYEKENIDVDELDKLYISVRNAVSDLNKKRKQAQTQGR